MIDLNKAIELANVFYRGKGQYELTKIYEAEQIWIIYARKDNRPRFGSAGISIDKESGEIKSFILPSDTNLAILKNAKLITIK